MSKIKVLQFPIANSYGGITHYALDNWRWIDKEKFHVDFATMSKKLDFADEITSTGSKIHYLSCYAEENREQFVAEVNAILDEGYDVVHLHTKQWKSFLMEEICLQRNIPKIIVHSHSTRCDANDLIKRQEETKLHSQVKAQFNTSYATDFWACSKEAADWLFGEQIPKSRIQIMKNAIEADKFIYHEQVRSQVREELGLGDSFVLGHVGRFVYPKNHEFLIEVFAAACRQKSNLKLLLAGDGNLEPDMKEKVKKLGIADKVLFLGKCAETNRLYQAMDLFVLPSRFEGLPLTLIEAQTAGLECICTDGITREAKITENLEYLPLEKDLWVSGILRRSKPYRRKNMKVEITSAGYDIASQIKIIEQNYQKISEKSKDPSMY